MKRKKNQLKIGKRTNDCIFFSYQRKCEPTTKFTKENLFKSDLIRIERVLFCKYYVTFEEI